MPQRFSIPARKVLALAHRAARRQGSPEILPEHILIGLIHAGPGLAVVMLSRLGADLDALVHGLAGEATTSGVDPDPDRDPDAPLPFSPAAARVLDRACAEARRFRHHPPNSVHLLLALVSDGDSVATMLSDLGVTHAGVLERLYAIPAYRVHIPADPEPETRTPGSLYSIPTPRGNREQSPYNLHRLQALLDEWKRMDGKPPPADPQTGPAPVPPPAPEP